MPSQVAIGNQERMDATAILNNFLLTGRNLCGLMGLIAESEDERYQVAKA